MATNSKQNEILAAVKERKKKLDNELSQKQKTNITKNTGISTSVTQKNKISTQVQKSTSSEVNKPQVIKINPDMLNDPEIKQAMFGFKNLMKKPLPIELKLPKKSVAHKIRHKLSNIKQKVQKALGR